MALQGPWVGKSVVVVDDVPLVREEIAALYRQLGMEVVGYAGEGIEALEQYDRLKPELLSLDIVMPHMNGIDCYRHLIKRDPLARVLFLTCLAGEQAIAPSFKEEFPPFLFVGKPVRLSQLQSSLSQVFQERGQSGADRPKADET